MRFITQMMLCILVTMGHALAGESSVYCPQNHGYVSLGMTQDEVMSICGTPTQKQKSNAPLMQKLPMTQLMYNNEGTPKAFYGVWSLSVGVTTGANLEVDIVNNKVYAVILGGESSKAFSICGGKAIVKGDPVSKVYAACGNPSAINDSYVTTAVTETAFPEIWLYEMAYQKSIRLTFLKGKLESID
jgi:hypothetical protein